MTAHVDERRASPRCNAVKSWSRIEFTAPEGRRRIGARLVNISRGGALVVAGIPMPHETPVWLRIESPVKTDWVDATIVRLDQERHVGLHFTHGCPDDLLLAGAVGLDIALLERDKSTWTTVGD
jgi:PilZ domain